MVLTGTYSISSSFEYFTCLCIFIGRFNEILTNTTKYSSIHILGIWAQKLHQVACVRCNCVHVSFTFTSLGYVFQYITLEIFFPALLDKVCAELEDGQNVKE